MHVPVKYPPGMRISARGGIFLWFRLGRGFGAFLRLFLQCAPSMLLTRPSIAYERPPDPLSAAEGLIIDDTIEHFGQAGLGFQRLYHEGVR